MKDKNIHLDWPYTVTVYYSFNRHGFLHRWLRTHIGHGRKLRTRDNPAHNLDVNAEWYFRLTSLMDNQPPFVFRRYDQIRDYYFKDNTAYTMFMLGWNVN